MDDKAEITLVRGPGIFGVIEVPYNITPRVGGNVTDLRQSGGVITFADLQVNKTLRKMASISKFLRLYRTRPP